MNKQELTKKANTPRHVMIDLETMGTTPDSAIVSIGAVIFDPRYGIITKNEFYMELDWESQNRLIDQETVKWWEGQSEEARAAHYGLDELSEALSLLARWLPKDAKVWGNGSTFDISMLEDAYRQLNIEIPWKFWNVRDCRTVLDMYESVRGGFNKTVNRNGAHNALQDAKFQAQYITMMWQKLLVK